MDLPGVLFSSLNPLSVNLIAFFWSYGNEVGTMSEEITFRQLGVGAQETRDEGRDHVVFQEPNFDGEQQQERPRPKHALNGATEVAPKTTASHGLRANGGIEDANAPDDHSDNSAGGGDEKLDSQAKDNALGHTPSLALAPTQSIKEGEAHRVVKKKTYLHQSSKMYSERIRTHTFLAKCLAVAQNIWTMVSTFPYWDMAFWSGFAYAVGSAMFIVDGAFAFGPLASPNRYWPEGEDKYAGPILFFLGAVVCYQTGAVMAYLEAINDGCFAGVAMKRFWIEGSDEDKKKLLDAKLHTFFGHIIPHHHHHDSDDPHTNDDVGKKTRADVCGGDGTNVEAMWRTATNRDAEAQPDPVQPTPSRRQAVDHGPGDHEAFNEYMTWRWWPTWHALRTYHVRELGYVACSIQLLGATLYGVTGIVVLPGVLSSLAWWQKIAAFWVPQVVASVCFLIAAIMFTIESQDVWYKPIPWTVRWWIGGWAAIGSVGFLLCACFGLGSHKYTWCEYQSDLSSTWGSASYLFSSLLQWYEAVGAGPVLAFPNNRTPVLMRKAKVTT
ncbi:uncharacterized protein N0V89_007052 [Didymosphaeria variabile]|uniref:Integral membrane protein n=1 Tax=Didymosphaeria variabile TaxID=1932322 RepID=A0A9W8XIG2_9PLEO|nr:uncharacterized protein N0V89_007052 [Didymosphaeria variabile]KAJ4351709.1 hypothetical protein N0V89_007052 [Didymosphaeria variabile]